MFERRGCADAEFPMVAGSGVSGPLPGVKVVEDVVSKVSEVSGYICILR